MSRDYVWGLEQNMIGIYLTLIHRINGIGLSLNDFWEMDTWTTSLIYQTELKLIEKEEKTQHHKGYSVNPEEKNNPQVTELYEEMFVDESKDY